MTNKIFFTMLIAALTFIPISGMFSITRGNNGTDLLKTELNLSDDQIKKIDSITEDTFKQIQSKQIDLERNEIDIKELMLKDNPDLSALKKLIDKKHSIIAEIEYLQVKKDLNIKSLLTADQAVKFKNLMNDGKKRMGPDQPPFQNRGNKMPMGKNQGGNPNQGNGKQNN